MRDLRYFIGGTMDWYVVDKNYINYLTKFDPRVGYVEYYTLPLLRIALFGLRFSTQIRKYKKKSTSKVSIE